MRQSGVAYGVGRGLLLVAALLFAVAFVIGVLPVRTRLLVYDPGRSVNCGSLLLPSSYAGDDGCEKRILGRIGWVLVPSLCAILVGGCGIAVLTGPHRRL